MAAWNTLLSLFGWRFFFRAKNCRVEGHLLQGKSLSWKVPHASKAKHRTTTQTRVTLNWYRYLFQVGSISTSKNKHRVIVVLSCSLRFFFPQFKSSCLVVGVQFLLFHSYLGGLTLDDLHRWKMSYSCHYVPCVKDDDVDMDEGLLLAERLTSAVTWRFKHWTTMDDMGKMD